MNKDPAFLFYSSDFLTGVAGLTMEERGQYITLLCLQHQHGHLPEKTIWLSLGLRSVSEIPDVMAKFQLDEKGLYYQDRLDEVMEKRSNFIDSRVVNGSKGGRPRKNKGSEEVAVEPTDNHKDNHMPNLRENENENVNKDRKESEEREERLPYKDIIDYLNLKVGANYKPTSATTRKAIHARFEEKFTLENFKTVIDTKVADWKGDEKMQKYLCPETLFSNKFEKYLNQKPVSSRAENKPTHTEGSAYKL